MSEWDEPTILDRALAGDERAFGEIVDAHQGVVFNLALRMLNDHEDARDVAQAVFLKVWQHLGRFDRRGRLFSWIYRIALNETLNYRRGRRRHDEVDEALPSSDPGPASEYESGRRSQRVQEALMELKPEDREIVVLHHVLRLSHREIGELRHLPEKTVKSRLFTARQRLEARLRRRGFGTP
jgi:RNA polymerase sigma-70 factor (ECF subfamily)